LSPQREPGENTICSIADSDGQTRFLTTPTS
jgi:hypothetical protein